MCRSMLRIKVNNDKMYLCSIVFIMPEFLISAVYVACMRILDCNLHTTQILIL